MMWAVRISQLTQIRAQKTQLFLFHHLTLICKQKLSHSCKTISFLPECVVPLILYSHKINVRRRGEIQWASCCINTLVMWCAWFCSIHTHFTWEPYSKHEEDRVEEGRNFEENKVARYVVREKETSREAFPITQIYLSPLPHPFSISRNFHRNGKASPFSQLFLYIHN